jgi:hypothetical protein
MAMDRVFMRYSGLRRIRAEVRGDGLEIPGLSSEAWQPDTGALLRLQGKDSNQFSQSTHNGIRLAIAGLLCPVFREELKHEGDQGEQDAKKADCIVRVLHLKQKTRITSA